MITLITINAQGLCTLAHRQALLTWLNNFGPDICLQETHATMEHECHEWFSPNTACNDKYKYKCTSSPGTPCSSGVAILYKPCFQEVKSYRDKAGHLIIAEFSSDDLNFQVVCLYGPNKKEGTAFFEALYPVIDLDIPVLVAGDFNTVVDPHLDHFGCNPDLLWAYNWPPALANLTEAFQLPDAWHDKHPGVVEFTWCCPNGSQGSRINMIWLPEWYMGLISLVGIFPFFRSDHSYVHLEFNLPSAIEQGKGPWKFNTSHLSDEAFCSEIAGFWSDWHYETGHFQSLSSWWDAGKVHLKRLIHQLSRASSCGKKRKIQELNAAVADIHKQINDGEQLPGLLEEKKAELASELLMEAKGAQLRANIGWVEEGESSLAYFLHQEKVCGQRRLV